MDSDLDRHHTTTSASDRRRAKRYRVDVPVEFDGSSGVTTDVSQTGVLFATDREVQVGDLIDFSLVLGEPNTEWHCRIACIASVVRVDRADRGWLIAVDIQAYRSVQF